MPVCVTLDINDIRNTDIVIIMIIMIMDTLHALFNMLLSVIVWMGD